MTDTAVARVPPRTLYELGEEFARLELALWESGGEVTPEVEEAFTALGALEGTKIDAYAGLVRSLERYRDAIKTERLELAAKDRTAENTIHRLKERMQEYLEGRGVQEVRGHTWRAAIQKHGGLRKLTLLVEPESLPRELTRIIVEADTDKLRALAEKEGGPDDEIVLEQEEVVVARLEKRGQSVRFR